MERRRYSLLLHRKECEANKSFYIHPQEKSRSQEHLATSSSQTSESQKIARKWTVLSALQPPGHISWMLQKYRSEAELANNASIVD